MKAFDKLKGPVGLYGGTFDPPHIGHLVAAETIRETMGLERIVFVPAMIPPHKDLQSVSNVVDRLNMVKLAISDNENFKVSQIEINSSKTSYTIDTVRYCLKLLSPENVCFIVGTDNFMEMYLWKEIDTLVDLCKFVMAVRPGYCPEDIGMEKTKLNEKTWKKLVKNIVQIPQVEVSSSFIKKQVILGKSIRYLVPEKVERYIIDKNLYK
ncbi:MAG: nicotinate-nucleotide adenylyltransferase [Candidatus Theseobacter exili]|nr:nicotinate-nucleotide adenylyltransferase [Candidatus Theseobacter exili]